MKVTVLVCYTPYNTGVRFLLICLLGGSCVARAGQPHRSSVVRRTSSSAGEKKLREK
jgi:hypothetical protein